MPARARSFIYIYTYKDRLLLNVPAETLSNLFFKNCKVTHYSLLNVILVKEELIDNDAIVIMNNRHAQVNGEILVDSHPYQLDYL